MKAIFTVTTALLSNLFLVTQSYAALVTINVSGQINFVDGTYSPDLTVSDNINAVFVYDTDEAQATSADTVGSTDPGHEYTSFFPPSLVPQYRVSSAPLPTSLYGDLKHHGWEVAKLIPHLCAR